MGSFSLWHWLIVLAVVLVLFGTRKLKSAGTDLGGAVRGFKEAMGEERIGAPPGHDAALADSAGREAAPERRARA